LLENSSRRPSVLLLWALAIAGLVLVVVRGPPAPVLHPDTPGYLDWAAHRPPLYPLALAAWQALFGSIETIGYAQVAILSAALAWLATEIFRVTGSRVAGALLIVSVLGRANLVGWTFAVLTDGPFACCVLLLAASLLRYAREPSPRTLALASAIIGLGIGLRPVAWCLVPALPLTLWLVGPASPGRRRIAAALIPVIAFSCLWWGVQRAHHADSPPRSHGRHSLMGKVAFIRAAPAGGRFAAIADHIAEQMEPARRVDLELDSLAARFHWRAPVYDVLRFEVLREPLETASRSTGIAPDWIGGEVAFDIIRAEPGQYLYDVFLNAYAMWSPPNLLTTAQASSLGAIFAAHSGLDRPLTGRHWLVIVPFKLFYLAAFVCSLVVVGLALWRRLRGQCCEPLIAVLAVLSTATHAYVVTVALVQAGLSRYALMVWPLQVLLVVCLAAAFVARRRQARAP